MIKIDLITGFLGSGKTTFLRKYVKYLLKQGENICILENDYGAVNVDMMLLSDLTGDHCDIEMVAGGCDSDCHQRRFKSKLITMGMLGYSRVVVEPSGVFDIDEFFDSLEEDPLHDWYEIGSVITIADAGIRLPLSDTSDYVFASEAARAGIIIMSKTQLHDNLAKVPHVIKYLNQAFTKIGCKRQIRMPEIQTETDKQEKDTWNDGDVPSVSSTDVLTKSWDCLTDSDFSAVMHAGYKDYSFVKQQVLDEHRYESLYFMEKGFQPEELKQKAAQAIADPECGGIIRIKGFCRDKNGWMEINVTREDLTESPIENGQDIVIAIGEHLGKEKLESWFGKAADVHAD